MVEALARTVQTIGRGVWNVLRDPVSIAVLAAGWVVLMAILVAVPAAQVVGNDVAFQLTVLRPRDWFLLSTLALLASYSIAQSLYLLRFRRCGAKATASSAAAGIWATGGSFAALITCPACLVGLAGFLSAGTIAALQQWRGTLAGTVAIGAITLLAVGAHLAGSPEVCRVARKE